MGSADFMYRDFTYREEVNKVDVNNDGVCRVEDYREGLAT